MPLSFSSERLDKVLANLLPEHSRSRLQQWIAEGWVRVNEQAAKVRQTIRAGDRIWVHAQPSQEQTAFSPEALELDIVASTGTYIIVNKVAGMVTHPGAGNWSGTLLNGLLYHFPELGQIPRAGIVHRLDKDTSGLLMIARTETAQTHLVRQLQERSVGRQYMALVKGHLAGEGVIDAAIGRDRRVAVRMSTDSAIAPKEARTHYRSVRRGCWQGHSISLVVCRLETGRTHQIRVHLASLGHPLIGDSLYGGPAWAGAERQMLHAQNLSFIDPANGSEQHFTAVLAPDMQAVHDTIEWQ
ncbi:MAG: RluA family pseudouridine synthase [Alcaligenaceae bacterium]|nr:RluA family pseudouridine synthase [Alcaligenaceae bacterium]